MHSILFAVTRPSDDSEHIQEWSAAVTTIGNRIGSKKGIEPLGKGAWLILGADGLSFLGKAIDDSVRSGFPYRVVIVEKAYDWTPATTPPKSYEH
jgi:hypothetical protein